MNGFLQHNEAVNHFTHIIHMRSDPSQTSCISTDMCYNAFAPKER